MPAKRSNPETMHRAGELRKNLTPAEQKLWTYLCGNKLDGVSFRRQHAIGPYIVDFCAIKEKLLIELDGGQHAEQEEHDQRRTEYLDLQGFHVIRFWNAQVMNDLNGVIRSIQFFLKDK